MKLLSIERDIHHTIDMIETITLDKLLCETDQDLHDLESEEYVLFEVLDDLFMQRFELSLH